ncbi:hypothetical protein D3C75_459230 [compost metagenome]
MMAAATKNHRFCEKAHSKVARLQLSKSKYRMARLRPMRSVKYPLSREENTCTISPMVVIQPMFSSVSPSSYIYRVA